MSTMVTFTGLGLLLTHALVPPTPGILATAMDLEADIGLVIVYGIIISLISFFITWLLLKSWAAKEFIKPLSKFSGEVSDGKELKEIPYTLAFLPILLPIIFIASSSIVNLYTADGGAINQVMNVLGDRVVALFSGVVMVFLLAFMFKQKVYDSAMKEDKEVNLNTPFIQLITNSWVARGAAVALLPLLVTGLSGSIANLIRENENVGVLAEIIASGPVPYILIPYALSAVLVATIGSATTAALTTAGIIMPMMPVLGLSPELTALSIGAGSLAITHLNNSGFWVNVLLFNLSTKQGLKYITFPAFVASVVAICLLSVAYMAGLV